jgi:hypothetical protein
MSYATISKAFRAGRYSINVLPNVPGPQQSDDFTIQVVSSGDADLQLRHDMHEVHGKLRALLGEPELVLRRQPDPQSQDPGSRRNSRRAPRAGPRGPSGLQIQSELFQRNFGRSPHSIKGKQEHSRR